MKVKPIAFLGSNPPLEAGTSSRPMNVFCFFPDQNKFMLKDRGSSLSFSTVGGLRSSIFSLFNI